jgi:hypothetical protein
MTSSEDRLINLAIHESSDPEMLKRDAQSKTTDEPNASSGDTQNIEEAIKSDEVDASGKEMLADRQISITNLSAG